MQGRNTREEKRIYIREYMRAMRKSWRSEGRCICCGAEKGADGYATCPSCRERQRQKQREYTRRKKMGLIKEKLGRSAEPRKVETCEGCVEASECLLYEPGMKRCEEYKAESAD